MSRSLLKQQEHSQVKTEETRLACSQYVSLHQQITSLFSHECPNWSCTAQPCMHSEHFSHASQLIFVTQNWAVVVGTTCYFNRLKGGSNDTAKTASAQRRQILEDIPGLCHVATEGASKHAIQPSSREEATRGKTRDRCFFSQLYYQCLHAVSKGCVTAA